MLFPSLIDGVQQDRFLESFVYGFGFRVVSLFQITYYIIYAFSVGNGNDDIVVTVALLFVNPFDDRVGHSGESVDFAFECGDDSLVKGFGKHRFFFRTQRIGIEWQFYGEYFQDIFLQTFIVAGLGIFLDEGLCCVVHHVYDVDADTFSHQGMVAFLIDDFPLGVHHVVVFEQAFADTEVVLFDFSLGTFDGFGNHRVFDHFSFFKTQPVHYFGDSF